jgi:cellulose synthase/poly-beta-1,6-N-acetylglucosamine synthase-like glycosyltransferase
LKPGDSSNFDNSPLKETELLAPQFRFAAMLLFWIFIIFLSLYGCLLFFYKKSWQSLSNFDISQNANRRFISVIIPARNEEQTIHKLLSSLEAQSYPKDHFEIIIIDDFSTDNTSGIIKSFPLDNLFLISPNVPFTVSSKKKAIEAGINMASGELIAVTDADCILPPSWLSTINNFYVATDASFIAAPVKFSNDQSLLQTFQSLDFLTLQGITAASVGKKFHAMCNGANLAYKKQAFINVSGFEGIDTIATGDDMLLMYKIWKQNPEKIFYLKNKEAIVTTEPMPTWKDFFMQRKRWASKTLVYDDYRIIAVLLFVYLFNCLFFILVAASFFNPVYWLYALAYLVLKTAVEWPFLASVTRFYDEQRLMKYFIIFQPLHIFYTVFIGALSQFGKYEWKGRTTK